MADFAVIKEQVSIEQAAQMLGLQLRSTGSQLRGACPACKSGGDRALVVTPSKALFYCFAAGIGGDLISLVGHIKQCSPADAGTLLADHFKIGKAPTVPPAREAQKQEGALKPLDYLQHDHEAVVAVGFDPEVANALGIGFAAKGMMRGTVAVPLRDECGNLVAYMGVTEARLPKEFHFPASNIVPLKRA